MKDQDLVVEAGEQRSISPETLRSFAHIVKYVQALSLPDLKALIGNPGPDVPHPNLEDKTKYRVSADRPERAVMLSDVLKGARVVQGSETVERRALKSYLLQTAGERDIVGIPHGRPQLSIPLNVSAYAKALAGPLSSIWCLILNPQDIIVQRDATLLIGRFVNALFAKRIHIELGGRIVCEGNYLRVNCTELRGAQEWGVLKAAAARPSMPTT